MLVPVLAIQGRSERPKPFAAEMAEPGATVDATVDDILAGELDVALLIPADVYDSGEAEDFTKESRRFDVGEDIDDA